LYRSAGGDHFPTLYQRDRADRLPKGISASEADLSASTTINFACDAIHSAADAERSILREKTLSKKLGDGCRVSLRILAHTGVINRHETCQIKNPIL
jgi:hypothetical protein